VLEACYQKYENSSAAQKIELAEAAKIAIQRNTTVVNISHQEFATLCAIPNTTLALTIPVDKYHLPRLEGLFTSTRYQQVIRALNSEIATQRSINQGKFGDGKGGSILN
jgi:hypothetical protein